MAQQMCRHPGCTCTARSDGFCADACARHDPDSDPLCLCGHDECEAPTKFESREAMCDLAPEGRFVERPTRDW